VARITHVRVAPREIHMVVAERDVEGDLRVHRPEFTEMFGEQADRERFAGTDPDAALQAHIGAQHPALDGERLGFHASGPLRPAPRRPPSIDNRSAGVRRVDPIRVSSASKRR